MDARRSLFAPQLKAGIETLSRLPFLRGSKEAFLVLLANTLQVRLVEPGQVIAQEGEEQTELIVLRKGSAKGVWMDGQEEIFRDGTIIGDPVAFHSKLPWALTVTATDFCDVQILTGKAYKSAIGLHPGEGTRIGKALNVGSSRISTIAAEKDPGSPRKPIASPWLQVQNLATPGQSPSSTPPLSPVSTGSRRRRTAFGIGDQSAAATAAAAVAARRGVAAGALGASGAGASPAGVVGSSERSAPAVSSNEAEVEHRKVELQPVLEESHGARSQVELPDAMPSNSVQNVVRAARRSMALRKVEAALVGGKARSRSPSTEDASRDAGSSHRSAAVGPGKAAHLSLPLATARGKARKSYAPGMDAGVGGGLVLPAAGARKSVAVVGKLAGLIDAATAASAGTALQPQSARKSLAVLPSSASRKSLAVLPASGSREVRKSLAVGMGKPGARKSLAVAAQSLDLAGGDSVDEGSRTRPEETSKRGTTISHERSSLEKMKAATKGIVSAARALNSMSALEAGMGLEKVQDAAWEDSHDALHIWAYAMQEDDEASRRELAGWLDKIPFFNRMDAFVFERILPIVKKRAFKRGECILEEGKPSEALHVIYAGHAHVMSSGSRIASIGPEEVIGERSIANLGSGPLDMPVSAASVVVKTTVLVTIALPRAPLAEIVAKDAWLYRQFEEMYSHQMSEHGGLKISNMPLFKEADPAFMLQLEISMGGRKVAPGEFLVKEGEALQQAFILVHGTVKIVRESNKAHPMIHTVNDIEQAVFLCEMNVCGLSFTAPCTIRAISGCMCQIITQDALHKAFDCHPTESWIFRKLVEDAESFKRQIVAATKTSDQYGHGRGALKLRRVSDDDALKASRGMKVVAPKAKAVSSGPVSALQRSRVVAIGAQEESSSCSASDAASAVEECMQGGRTEAKAEGLGKREKVRSSEDDLEVSHEGLCSGPEISVYAVVDGEASAHASGDIDDASSEDGLSSCPSEAVSEAWDIHDGSGDSASQSRASSKSSCINFGKEGNMPAIGEQEAEHDESDQASVLDEAEASSDESMKSDMEEAFTTFSKARSSGDCMRKGPVVERHGSGGSRAGVQVKVADDSEAEQSFDEEENEEANEGHTDLDTGHTWCGTKRVMILHDLRLIPEFSSCAPQLLRQLESHMRLRLYLPDQIVLRLGEDMGDLYILQRGCCKMEVFNTEMEPVQSPCIIGGMMSLLTPKVVTTVVAQVTSFVATISKHNVAHMLDGHPEERKALFSKANQVFSDLCDDFHSRYGKDGLVQRLQSLPLLAGAAPPFLRALTGVLEPRLLLPGQAIVQEADEVHLFILFEGYCHVLSRDTVVGTISKKMVFGEMEVFGLGAGLDTRGGNSGPITVKTVEFCQVGTISSPDLFSALEAFPEERMRFEQLVHNRLEESVCAQVSNRPCFEGMPNHLFSKVCNLLERRLCFSSDYVVQQGEQGECMIIVNRGKAELVYSSVPVGMLWPGKTFGSPQMLGVERVYHASLLPKTTCHLLLMSKKALNSLATGTAERRWILSLRDRARATLEAETRTFQKKVREQKHMACSGMFQSAMAGDAADSNRFLGSIFYAWKTYCSRLGAALGFKRRSSAKQMRATTTTTSEEAAGAATDRMRRQRSSRAARQHDPEAMARLFKGTHTSLAQQQLGGVACEPPPMNFMRGLKRVQLEDTGEGIVSAAAWKPHSQNGRLDVWRSLAAPDWLTAVRDEIPSQFMLMKREARGEVISQGLTSYVGVL